MKKYDESRSGSKRTFFSSESATATAIGAVLLLGIIFSVLTILWVFCIPEWKSDAEYSHMGDVYEDMAEVKSKIDMMSIVLASNPNSSYISSPNPSSSAPQLIMSVPFQMGGGSIPLVGPIKSSGSLAVNKENYSMGIVVEPKPDPQSPNNKKNNSNNYSKFINCGTITYNSQNRYYVDQNFSYECGALILDQKEQSVMTLYPSIRFSKAQDNEYNVSINAVRIFQKPYVPPEIISSNSECTLRLIGIDYRPLYDNKAGNISRLELTIYTKYPDAWEQYLYKSIKDVNLDGDCILEGPPEKPFVLLIFPKETSTKSLKKLYISETVVKAEPGIGLN
ncbi:MAG TPA: hypothetical protein VGK06_08650 [Methanosarcina sp.]